MTEPIPTNRDTPPTGWHVHVLPSGGTCPASEPETWHRYRSLYGAAYPWREATAEEIAEAQRNWDEVVEPSQAQTAEPPKPDEQLVIGFGP